MDRVVAGRYELEVPLGRGGAGEVWRGRDMATSKPVAVKLVDLSPVDDPAGLTEAISRFRREAAVISELRQQNVVAAIDAGRIANQIFTVTELAPGVSLADRMDQRGARGMGLFPVGSVLRLAAEVCPGLTAAHEAGVVHRGIKPGNLMVTSRHGVKIVDFGVARLIADNARRLAGPAQTTGSIAYMSPEQAQNFDLDGRADLYSLGCVLYQLLSGRTPFFSALPSALLMMQVMDRPAPLEDVRPGLPAGLPELVAGLMEKEPAARPATAAEVLGAIEDIERTLGPEPLEDLEDEDEREKVGAGDQRGATGETRWEPAVSRLGRSATLSPGLTGPLLSAPPAVTAAPATVAAALPAAAVSGAIAAAPPAAAVSAAVAAAPSWERSGPTTQVPVAVPVPAQPGPPVPSAPQAATGRGKAAPARPGGAPDARSRPAWRGVVGILLAAAMVAGAGVYFWERAHQTLKITTVRVAAANQSVGCDGTAHLVGTILTNGHGGPITYQWVRGGQPGPEFVVDDASGSDEVRVPSDWAFHHTGNGQAVAVLRVLTPERTQSSITFPYSCPR